MPRLPLNLFNTADRQTSTSILGAEILAEQAASLKHAGSAVEEALRTLQAVAAEDPARPGLVIAAAGAVHAYLIQQELVGIHTHGNHDSLIEGFGIPREVMAKIGVRA